MSGSRAGTCTESHGKESNLNEDKSLTVFRRLIHDNRIADGAFRLWHYLHNRKNKSGKCWPEQRNIARELGCKTHSLRRWTFQLVNAGYLETEKKGQNHHLEYTILFGDGKGDMPEWATRGVAQTDDTKNISRSPKGNVALPQEATPRVAETGDGSNHKGVITGSKGTITPPIFEPVKRGLFRREYEAMIRDAETEVKKARNDPTLRARVLKKEITRLCKFLRDEAQAEPEKSAENMKRATDHENNSENYCLGELTEQGKAVVTAWKNRIAEIRNVMNGRIA